MSEISDNLAVNPVHCKKGKIFRFGFFFGLGLVAAMAAVYAVVGLIIGLILLASNGSDNSSSNLDQYINCVSDATSTDQLDYCEQTYGN